MIRHCAAAVDPTRMLKTNCLDGQSLPGMYLPHHELTSVLILNVIIVIINVIVTQALPDLAIHLSQPLEMIMEKKTAASMQITIWGTVTMLNKKMAAMMMMVSMMRGMMMSTTLTWRQGRTASVRG